MTVMSSFGVDFSSSLSVNFSIGRGGNSTPDPGIDPDGLQVLMRHYGGQGRIHNYSDRGTFLHELVGRLNAGVPVVAFTQGGNHAVTVYGYEAVAGGAISALFVADPLSGFMGRVAIGSWHNLHLWMGTSFQAAGARWQNRFIFVSFNEWRTTNAPSQPKETRLVATVPALASRYLSQSPYPVIAQGERTLVTLTFRNTGTGAWVKGSASEARLGIVGDSTIYSEMGFAQNWLLPARPTSTHTTNVAPNEVGVFNFEVRGAQRGTWMLHLRLVVDGVTWLDDEGVYVLLQVR